MVDVHVLQWAVVFLAATWLTARWLLDPPTQRWRHLVAGIASTLLWIPVAYTSNDVHTATDGGGTVAFGSSAIGGVATFMIVVCVAGLVLGLLLWVEQSADEASAELPRSMQRGD